MPPCWRTPCPRATSGEPTSKPSRWPPNGPPASPRNSSPSAGATWPPPSYSMSATGCGGWPEPCAACCRGRSDSTSRWSRAPPVPARGGGAPFPTRLPLVAGEVPPPPPARPHARAGSERILLVEDQPGLRRLAVEVLRGAGYEVTPAVDGQVALDLLAAG